MILFTQKRPQIACVNCVLLRQVSKLTKEEQTAHTYLLRSRCSLSLGPWRDFPVLYWCVNPFKKKYLMYLYNLSSPPHLSSPLLIPPCVPWHPTRPGNQLPLAHRKGKQRVGSASLVLVRWSFMCYDVFVLSHLSPASPVPHSPVYTCQCLYNSTCLVSVSLSHSHLSWPCNLIQHNHMYVRVTRLLVTVSSHVSVLYIVSPVFVLCIHVLSWAEGERILY